MYQQGKALNSASHFELDDVIDPVESRRWILTGLALGAPARAAHRQEAPARRFMVNGAASQPLPSPTRRLAHFDCCRWAARVKVAP